MQRKGWMLSLTTLAFLGAFVFIGCRDVPTSNAVPAVNQSVPAVSSSVGATTATVSNCYCVYKVIGREAAVSDGNCGGAAFGRDDRVCLRCNCGNPCERFDECTVESNNGGCNLILKQVNRRDSPLDHCPRSTTLIERCGPI